MPTLTWSGGTTTGGGVPYSDSGGATTGWWSKPSGYASGPSLVPGATATPTPTPTPTGSGSDNPGSFGVDITSVPNLANSVSANVQSGSDLFANIGKALFGEKGLVAQAPLLGQQAAAVGRFLGDNPLVSSLYQVPGAVANVGGGILSSDALATQDAGVVKQRYAMAPQTPAKDMADAAIAADPFHSIHLQHQFLVAQAQEDQKTNPKLLGDLFVPGGTLIDTLGELIDVTRVPQRFVERGIAGISRLDEIRRIQAGQVFGGNINDPNAAKRAKAQAEGPLQLNEQENIVAQRLASGQWNEAQALDFLASSSAGLSHDALTEIVGQIVTDPTVWASIGAAGVERIGLKGVELLAKEGKVGAELASGRSADILRAAGGAYKALEGTTAGRVAKVTRTIIDPLHAVGGRKVLGETMLDMYSQDLAKAGTSVYGYFSTARVLGRLHDLSPQVYDKVASAFGVYIGNAGRTVLGDNHVAAAIAAGEQEVRQLVGTNPADVIGMLIADTPKGPLIQQVKEFATRVAKLDWQDSDLRDLAKRMAAGFGHQGEDAWYEWLKPLAKERGMLGYLHAASYGAANRSLLEASRSALATLGRDAVTKLKLERIVLLNRSTLTKIGAEGFLNDIAGAVLKPEAKALAKMEKAYPKTFAALGKFKKILELQESLVREFMDQYPSVGVVSLNSNSIARDIERFTTWLERRVEDGVLPAQVTDRELAKMPAEFQALADTYKGSFDLGFSPELDKKWGLIPDLEGNLRKGFEPWVDHVADVTPGFRPGGLLRQNIAGMPILGKPFRGVLDAVDAGARTLGNTISARQVTLNASARFAASASERGLTKLETRNIWTALADRAQLNKVSARALHGQEMWEATAHLIPPGLYDSAGMAARDLRIMVLDAFQGDLRYVGLTQELTGRAKSLLGGVGDNMVGKVTEDYFPKYRFTYNPIFQLQRRLEGIILNSQRGVMPAFSGALTEADKLTAEVMERYARTGVFRIADTDMREFSALSLFGTDATHALEASVDPGKWRALVDVAAAERANVIRTFRANLGPALRTSMEKADPGAWDNIVAQMSENAGKVLDDGEAAVRYLTEMSLDGDVNVDHILRPGASSSDFFKLSERAVWHLPRTLGEVMPLNMERMAASLQIRVAAGGALDTIAKIRAALADKSLKFDRIAAALSEHNAHPDYIAAVERALDFHYDGFMRKLGKKFDLDAASLKRIENMIAGAADARGVTPVEYLSEILSPTIGRGNDAVMNDLSKAVAVLRAPKEGGSEEMLMSQLADIFHAHLDPSGRQVLLDEFERGLSAQVQAAYDAGNAAAGQELQTALESLRGGWSTGTADEFARAILERAETGTVHANPEVERVFEYFSHWSKTALTNGLLDGAATNPYAALLKKVANIPTDNAFAFNKTQQMVAAQVAHAIKAAENDAFRLHFFARDRTFLERSLNHMFFGIYPASYMYGKLLPEMARFIATEPFGLRTGGLAYALSDVQKSLATQYEYDPKMRKKVEKLGKNGAVWFLGYLWPAVPWDVGAGAPVWARNLAKQVEANKTRVADGKPELPIDLWKVEDSLSTYLDPLRSVGQLKSPTEAIGNALNPPKPKEGGTTTNTGTGTVPPLPTAAPSGAAPLAGGAVGLGPGIPSGENLSQKEWEAYYAKQVEEYRTFATSIRGYLDEVNQGKADAGDLPDVVTEFQNNIGWNDGMTAAFLQAVKRDGPNSALVQFFPRDWRNESFGNAPPELMSFSKEFDPTGPGNMKWQSSSRTQVEDLRSGMRNPEAYVLHSAQAAIDRAGGAPKATIRTLYPIPGELGHIIYGGYAAGYEALQGVLDQLSQILR